MNLTPEVKKIIDDMSVFNMLYRSRFAPLGDPMFINESGDYFIKVMAKKRSALDPGEWTTISKSIGWGK